jgi:hypothetical protein
MYLKKIVSVPWKAGRRWRARTRVVAACEASFQRHKKRDVEPGRLLSTQSSQLPADAQPIATNEKKKQTVYTGNTRFKQDQQHGYRVDSFKAISAAWVPTLGY